MRCPKCGGTVTIVDDELSCMNCGWAGPTRSAPLEPNKPRDRDAQYERAEQARKEYHKKYQALHATKTKRWHRLSYLRRRLEQLRAQGKDTTATRAELNELKE